MTEPDPAPDDLVVSAALDGVASPEEVDRVLDDPVLAGRLAQFRRVGEAVRSHGEPVDPRVREAHLSKALAVAPPSALEAARSRRHPGPRRLALLSAAAVVLLLAAAGAVLVRVVDQGAGGDAQIASEARSDEATNAGSVAGTGPADAEDAAVSTTVPDTGAEAAVPAPDALASESDPDRTAPFLGAFTSVDALVVSVRAELALDRDLPTSGGDDLCSGRFDPPALVVGRASIDGAEGIVYVDPPAPEGVADQGRRLWLVASATDGVGDGGAVDRCTDVVPVQRL